MKIALISYWSCPLTRIGVLSAGGMSVYILNFANQLGKLGHKVDIYTRVHGEKDESIIETHQNIRIIHLSQNSKDLYKDVKIYSEKMFNFINRNALEYDIIHTHYFYSALVGIYVKERLSLPLLHTFHSLAISKMKLGGVEDRKRIEIEKEIVNKVDGVVVSTEIEKSDLINDYHTQESKISIVNPGVNKKIFRLMDKSKARAKLGFPKNCKIILFVGRIDPIKSISTLILALDLLIKKYKSMKKNKYKSEDLQVILIGGDISSRKFKSNPEVKKIISIIEKKRLECCVKFFGSKPHYILPFYYGASDIVVLPSIYESFGLVILEAMACGSFVVASKVGGLKYLIKDNINGKFFQSGNEKDLSDKIFEGLTNPKFRSKLRKNAYETSRNFHWEQQTDRLIKVYKKYI